MNISMDMYIKLVSSVDLSELHFNDWPQRAKEGASLLLNRPSFRKQLEEQPIELRLSFLVSKVEAYCDLNWIDL